MTAVLALLALSLPFSSQEERIAGVTWDGWLIHVDPSTGVSVRVAQLGYTGIQALAKDSTGRMIGLGERPEGHHELFELDPYRGVATTFRIPYVNDVRGLAFSPDDHLYAVNVQGDVTSKLYVFDPAEPPPDAHPTLIGRCESADGVSLSLFGLDFAPDGELYAWSTAYGLMRVDPLTALCTNVNGLTDGTTEIQSIVFADDGRLYGLRDRLFAIDPSSGIYAPLTDGGFGDVRGAELLTLVLPSFRSKGAQLFQPPGPFAIAATRPASLEVAPVDTTVSILFDHPVDRSTLDGGSFRVRGEKSGLAAGQLTVTRGRRRVTFLPARPFSAGENVWVHLSRRITDARGRPLTPAGYSFQFRAAVTPTTGVFTEYASVPNDSTAFQTRLRELESGDLDHDGYVDLVTVNDQIEDARAFLNLADGSGLVAGPVITSLGGNTVGESRLADLNGDDQLDMALVDQSNGTTAILYGAGAGSFALAQSLSFPGAGVAAIDIDGDADLDIAVTSIGMIRLFENDGSGSPTSFQVAGASDGGVSAENLLEAGDMNQDGVTDLVVTSTSPDELRSVIGDGWGTFTPAGIAGHLTAGVAFTLELGDVDLDGDVDAAVGSNPYGLVGILGNRGNGVFAAIRVLPAGGSTLAGTLGDLDGDGDLDWGLAINGSSASAVWRLYRNGGTGSYTLWQDIPASSISKGIALFDSDRDGDLDLALGDEIQETIQLLRND